MIHLRESAEPGRFLHGVLAAQPRSERRALPRQPPARFAERCRPRSPPPRAHFVAEQPAAEADGGADVNRRASIPPSSTAGAPRQLRAHSVFRPADDARNGNPHGPRSGSERGPKYGRGSGHAPVIGRYSDRPSGGIWTLASDSEFAVGVTASDPAVFVIVPIVSGIFALLAVWVPAQRATRI